MVTVLASTTVDELHSTDPKQRRDQATRELLSRRAATTDEELQQALLNEAIELNLGIAHSIASRFRGRGVESDDLDQVAYLGLLKAARSYNPSTGTPFLAYAVPTIRGEVKRYFRDCSWTVRIPRRLQELQGSIASVRPQLVQDLQRDPTLEELAAELGTDVAEVEAAIAADGCFSVLSLDRPVDGDSTANLADTIADEEDTSFERTEAVAMLEPVLNDLTPRERKILELRFIEGHTQADIGAEIGVSQMQVSRLLRGILDRLREQIESPNQVIAA
ncbi:RNA polymerase, sigma 28 subunit, Sig B/F/G subfamily [Kribbella flavida DSM 17836]|uniref:RNA polymerase, sigma 28 subunit, Sig B/F/G subfamily n=1 Tax=Kribbella flavida (strain DSM 17836 / JCM 10339 / NBRC 14399) TaxID=479435 RepID=D2PXG8_KRIFD|nr:SigB/SigF/SigG family RNA polymerase sigma factor [Kribbella flavida]ADB29816.1 RNA polymerase, sigma 28 subunit, Sig B/F/G subfamily [Kribbella flavida DSM 17836]